MSRFEELMQKLLNGETITEADFPVMSRLEKALIACINKTGTDGLDIPQSRAEELLQLLSVQMTNLKAEPETEELTVTPGDNYITKVPSEGKYFSKVTVNGVITSSVTVQSTESTQEITPESGQYFNKVIVEPAAVEGTDMLQARVDAFNSCKYLLYSYSGNNVDFISNLDTSNVTDMYGMFSGCSSLTTVPALNTSNVTTMQQMFFECRSLTTIPLLDTSNVTDMTNMFGYCVKLTTIPALDTSNVTNMTYLFNYCKVLTTIPLLDTSNVTTMQQMFYECSALTTIPLLDTSNVTRMNTMFYRCSALTTVPALDVSNVTNFDSIFSYCTSLKSILMTGMKKSFNISASTQFEREDLLTILNNLATLSGSGVTLTMGSTNLAKLTEEDQLIATAKRWTLK